MPQFPMTPDRQKVLEKYPDYAVATSPATGSVTVTAGGKKIAESSRALVIEESFHAPVCYLPRDDVRMEMLERTEHTTYCPFKGHASYWSLRLPDRIEENVVWSYEDPFAEVEAIRELLAFYSERVDVEYSPH